MTAPPLNLTSDLPDAYRAFPALARDGSGRLWVAWCTQAGRENTLHIRSVDPSTGALSPVERLDAAADTSCPPCLLVGAADAVHVVWCRQRHATWQVVRRSRDLSGAWSQTEVLAADAWHPAACIGPDDHVWVAWTDIATGALSVHGPRGIACLSDTLCARPTLLATESGVVIAWDSYEDGRYSIRARCWSAAQAAWSEEVTVSRGPDWSMSPQLGLGVDGRVLCCWVASEDVRDDAGVIDQWSRVRCAELDGPNVRLLGGDEHGTVADLCHGLLARREVWGYLGRRRHPFLRMDADRLPWLMWERKAEADGHASPGQLLARRLSGESWGPVHLVAEGHVFYEVERRKPGADAQLWAACRAHEGRAAWDILVTPIALTEDSPSIGTSADDWSRWRSISLLPSLAPVPPAPIPFFGDVHAHGGLSSDAEGDLDELYLYARDKPGLDFVALVDNDCYQCPLTDWQFAASLEWASRFNDDGTFVTLPGYEWTLWDKERSSHPDHRTVLFPGPAELLRHIDPGTLTTADLARRVDELGGMLFTQHWDWTLTDSPAERGLEVTSAWAYYIDNPEPFHRELLAGRRLAFVGGSDSHRRNPGTCGALTGVYAETLTRGAIFAALRQRRCYATSGSKMVLDVRVNGHAIGAELGTPGDVSIEVAVRGTRPLENLLITKGTVGKGPVTEAFSADLSGIEAAVEWTDPSVPPGTHFYYVTVKQQGEDIRLPSNLAAAQGCRAWSSPTWVTRV